MFLQELVLSVIFTLKLDATGLIWSGFTGCYGAALVRFIG